MYFAVERSTVSFLSWAAITKVLCRKCVIKVLLCHTSHAVSFNDIAEAVPYSTKCMHMAACLGRIIPSYIRISALDIKFGVGNTARIDKSMTEQAVQDVQDYDYRGKSYPSSDLCIFCPLILLIGATQYRVDHDSFLLQRDTDF
jgi:hypothetical protein